MDARQLGKSSLSVPPITFGAWAIGGWYWAGTDDAEAERAIQAGLDAGVTAIDTAPVYGFGHSERVVGRAIAARRAEVCVMTKAGLRWDDDGGAFYFATGDAEGRRLRIHRNARPASLRLECERSLERLGLDVIDLMQIHWPDPTTPIADSIGALLELRAEGKLREIGVSNYTPAMMDEARAALGDVPLASDQPRYSLLAREIERDVLPYAREHEIGTLVYSPLEQGLLTGKVGPDRLFPEEDGRSRHQSFAPANRARVNAALGAAVAPIARARGATIAQVVLAWTVGEPGITSALVGARRVEQVLENAAAAELRLTDDERARIRATFEALRLDAPRASLATRAKRIARRILGRR